MDENSPSPATAPKRRSDRTQKSEVTKPAEAAGTNGIIYSTTSIVETAHSDGRFLVSDTTTSRKRRTEETQEAPAKKKGKSKRPNQCFGGVRRHTFTQTDHCVAETKSIAARQFTPVNPLSLASIDLAFRLPCHAVGCF